MRSSAARRATTYSSNDSGRTRRLQRTSSARPPTTRTADRRAGHQPRTQRVRRRGRVGRSARSTRPGRRACPAPSRRTRRGQRLRRAGVDVDRLVRRRRRWSTRSRGRRRARRAIWLASSPGIRRDAVPPWPSGVRTTTPTLGRESDEARLAVGVDDACHPRPVGAHRDRAVHQGRRAAAREARRRVSRTGPCGPRTRRPRRPWSVSFPKPGLRSSGTSRRSDCPGSQRYVVFPVAPVRASSVKCGASNHSRSPTQTMPLGLRPSSLSIVERRVVSPVTVS